MSMRNVWRFIVAGIALVLGSASSTLGQAACVPRNLATPAPKDPVALVLAAQSTCPSNPGEFVDALTRLGARMEPTMVNFVGFNNPDPGAFFIFEIVSNVPPSTLTIQRGDLLFGHFTTARNGQLVSNQRGLTVELIAWDPDKQFYNFYELVGGNWFYRGDSKDILDDVQLLHRQRGEGANPFGSRLRCSGCHVNGGLLQKELNSPHNDWFLTDRQLPLAPNSPDAFVRGRLAELVDAGELSKLVTASARRLADSPGYQRALAARSLQERMRPLFCPMEVNIESDSRPVEEPRPDEPGPAVQIPSAFFVDPRLATATVAIDRRHYEVALQKLGSSLPEPAGRVDADHAWLTPVKAASDVMAIDALIEQGVVDKEFVAAVLAVDFTNPALSSTRCGLLKLVPDRGGPDFVARFQNALRAASLPGASDLLNNLSDPARNAAFHEKQAREFFASCQKRAENPNSVLDWVRLLAQRRIEVQASELSQNPRGHILEDPDRIVFPSTEQQAVAGRLALTPACEVK